MNSNIFFFLKSDVGLSVTITREGLFDEALIKPQDPSLNENLMPLTVKISDISCPSILILSFCKFLISVTKSSTTRYLK